MKIAVLDINTVTNGELDFSRLEALGQVVYYKRLPDSQLAHAIADADAVICNKAELNEQTLKYAKNLKYIGLFATGYNNIDLTYTNKMGICVCNAGSYSTNAVAQHTFALILAHYNNVCAYNDYVKNGNWIKSEVFSPFVFPLNELCGKTIGIVGYGSIAKAVIKIANAFNMNVLVHTRTPKSEKEVSFVSFNTLLENSDIISVHCPLNDQSRYMFNKSAFEKCKKGAYFVNTARGQIVDEQALAHALECGKLSGAAIDVLTYEPMLEDCVLYNAKNITFTPHIAWAPIETRTRLIDIVTDNLIAYLENRPQNVVGNTFYKKQNNAL